MFSMTALPATESPNSPGYFVPQNVNFSSFAAKSSGPFSLHFGDHSDAPSLAHPPSNPFPSFPKPSKFTYRSEKNSHSARNGSPSPWKGYEESSGQARKRTSTGSYTLEPWGAAVTDEKGKPLLGASTLREDLAPGLALHHGAVYYASGKRSKPSVENMDWLTSYPHTKPASPQPHFATSLGVGHRAYPVYVETPFLVSPPCKEKKGPEVIVLDDEDEDEANALPLQEDDPMGDEPMEEVHSTELQAPKLIEIRAEKRVEEITLDDADDSNNDNDDYDNGSTDSPPEVFDTEMHSLSEDEHIVKGNHAEPAHIGSTDPHPEPEIDVDDEEAEEGELRASPPFKHPSGSAALTTAKLGLETLDTPVRSTPVDLQSELEKEKENIVSLDVKLSDIKEQVQQARENVKQYQQEHARVKLQLEQSNQQLLKLLRENANLTCKKSNAQKRLEQLQSEVTLQQQQHHRQEQLRLQAKYHSLLQEKRELLLAKPCSLAIKSAALLSSLQPPRAMLPSSGLPAMHRLPFSKHKTLVMHAPVTSPIPAKAHDEVKDAMEVDENTMEPAESKERTGEADAAAPQEEAEEVPPIFLDFVDGVWIAFQHCLHFSDLPYSPSMGPWVPLSTKHKYFTEYVPPLMLQPPQWGDIELCLFECSGGLCNDSNCIFVHLRDYTPFETHLRRWIPAQFSKLHHPQAFLQKGLSQLKSCLSEPHVLRCLRDLLDVHAQTLEINTKDFQDLIISSHLQQSPLLLRLQKNSATLFPDPATTHSTLRYFDENPAPKTFEETVLLEAVKRDPSNESLWFTLAVHYLPKQFTDTAQSDFLPSIEKATEIFEKAMESVSSPSADFLEIYLELLVLLLRYSPSLFSASDAVSSLVFTPEKILSVFERTLKLYPHQWTLWWKRIQFEKNTASRGPLLVRMLSVLLPYAALEQSTSCSEVIEDVIVHLILTIQSMFSFIDAFKMLKVLLMAIAPQDVLANNVAPSAATSDLFSLAWLDDFKLSNTLLSSCLCSRDLAILWTLYLYGLSNRRLPTSGWFLSAPYSYLTRKQLLHVLPSTELYPLVQLLAKTWPYQNSPEHRHFRSLLSPTSALSPWDPTLYGVWEPWTWSSLLFQLSREKKDAKTLVVGLVNAARMCFQGLKLLTHATVEDLKFANHLYSHLLDLPKLSSPSNLIPPLRPEFKAHFHSPGAGFTLIWSFHLFFHHLISPLDPSFRSLSNIEASFQEVFEWSHTKLDRTWICKEYLLFQRLKETTPQIGFALNFVPMQMEHPYPIAYRHHRFTKKADVQVPFFLDWIFHYIVSTMSNPSALFFLERIFPLCIDPDLLFKGASFILKKKASRSAMAVPFLLKSLIFGIHHEELRKKILKLPWTDPSRTLIMDHLTTFTWMQS